MGSTQVLPDGNTLVGWGSEPYFSEYSESGKLLLDATLPAPDLSYRAVQVSHWTGLPLTAPSGAARPDGGGIVVYASWNGATTVRSWQVLGGPDPGHLAVVATEARSGFETAIHVATGSVFKIQALDAHGRVIGTSSVFTSHR
jgi:hypothetical protein